MQANNVLEFFPFSGIPMFEAAILAYKQIVRIFEMPSIQFLFASLISLICTNTKLLQPLAQFLYVSAVLHNNSELQPSSKCGQTITSSLARQL